MGISALNARVTILGMNDRAAWQGFLARLGGDAQDIYFDPRYLDLCAGKDAHVEAFGYEEGGEIFFMPYLKYAVNPAYSKAKAYDVESPYGYSGPLSTSMENGFLARAWEHFSQHCRQNAIMAAFIRFHALLENHRLIVALGIERSNPVVVLDLGQTGEEIWQGYSPNTRTHLRRAQKKDVTVRQVTGREGLRAFQKVYYKTMDRLKAREYYYFDDVYFDKIARDLEGHYAVFLASVDEVVIAGALVWLSSSRAYYHLSANLEEYKDHSAPSLLRHEAIMACKQGGMKQILFGGGKSPDPNDPLFLFKKGFSRETADFFVGKFVFIEELYQNACRAWEHQHPDLQEKTRGYFLKYKG